MNHFCVIESWVQAVVSAGPSLEMVPKAKNRNQTGSVPPPGVQ